MLPETIVAERSDDSLVAASGRDSEARGQRATIDVDAWRAQLRGFFDDTSAELERVLQSLAPAEAEPAATVPPRENSQSPSAAGVRQEPRASGPAEKLVPAAEAEAGGPSGEPVAKVEAVERPVAGSRDDTNADEEFQDRLANLKRQIAARLHEGGQPGGGRREPTDDNV